MTERQYPHGDTQIRENKGAKPEALSYHFLATVARVVNNRIQAKSENGRRVLQDDGAIGGG